MHFIIIALTHASYVFCSFFDQFVQHCIKAPAILNYYSFETRVYVTSGNFSISEKTILKNYKI